MTEDNRKIPRRTLDAINIDAEIQQRAVHLDNETVERYVERLQAGDSFPPVVVFEDKETGALRLADGFHRMEAYKRADKKQIPVHIVEGDRRAAILYAIKSNLAHGLPATRADRHKAATTLLRDKQWSRWSDRSIAKRVGLSHPTVAKLRKELEDAEATVTGQPEAPAEDKATGKFYQSDLDSDQDREDTGTQQSDKPTPELRERTFERNGKTRTMRTGNIGKKARKLFADTRSGAPAAFDAAKRQKGSEIAEAETTEPKAAKSDAFMRDFQNACVAVKQAADNNAVTPREYYDVAQRAMTLLQLSVMRTPWPEHKDWFFDLDQKIKALQKLANGFK